jgi:hypothetical protein
MPQRKKTISLIPAEKMALLAEKGLHAAHLSRAEMLSLAHGGLNEFYAIKKGIKSQHPPLDEQITEKVMATYFPTTASDTLRPSLMDISVRLTRHTIKVVTQTFDWKPDSPVFARRGHESGSVSFYKDTGKLTMHLELTKSCERCACINVRLTDKSKRERSSFEATLFQEDRCIELVHVNTNPTASFSTISPGDYLLRVSDKKGVIASVNIRLEE